MGGSHVKPLVPTRGTGKPFGFLIAMAGVSRVVLLAGGRRPLLPVDAAELVCSFLHLRPTRAFNLMPRMIDDLRGLSLCFLLDELYRMIYLEPAFDQHGRAIFEPLGTKYAIIVIQSIGIGTEWGRVLLQSVFRAPGAASAPLFEMDQVNGILLQSVVHAPGAAFAMLVSPRHRIRTLLSGAMYDLEQYMFHPDQLVAVNLQELTNDFTEMDAALGVYTVEGGSNFMPER
jgi:hypothetical protein